MQINFFQRRVASITLLLMGVTLAVALVVFTGEWSRTFWLELFALLFAELLFGAAHMHLFGRDDSILPYAAAVGPLSVGYLLFVLVMVFAVFCGMRFRYFALIHAIGFVAFVIAWLVHGMGAHAITEQDRCDQSSLVAKKTFYLDMAEVMENARTVFSGDKELLRHGDRVLDGLRYAAYSKTGMEASDRKVSDAILAVSAALDARDAAAFSAALQSLDTACRMREERARSL